jgi:hypothetical protein
MADEAGTVPYGRKTQHTPAIDEVHILWITAGLGCDGDTVSITAASEPSIEDVLLGAIPGLPKVHLHNPVLAVEVGDDFMKFFHQADRGEIDNFVLVLEGSIPNEKISGDGYWAAYGNDPRTGQPIRTTEWIDRLAPKALAVVGAGTCATYGGIHAMQGNPTGCMGLQDYLGRNWRSKAGLPIVNVPGCPVQPDNFMETRASRFHARIRVAEMPGKDRLLGTGSAVQRAQARLDFRHGRLPQCRRHLHRLHNAWFSRQVHAVHGRAPRRGALLRLDQTLWGADPAIAAAHQQHPQ